MTASPPLLPPNTLHSNAANLWKYPNGPLLAYGQRLVPSWSSFYHSASNWWSNGAQTKQYAQIAYYTLEQMRTEMSGSEPLWHFTVSNEKGGIQNITYEMLADKLLSENTFTNYQTREFFRLKDVAWNIKDAFAQIDFTQGMVGIGKEDVISYVLTDRPSSSAKLSREELGKIFGELKSGDRVASSAGKLDEIRKTLLKNSFCSIEKDIESLLAWRNDGLENLPTGWFIGRVIVTAASLTLHSPLRILIILISGSAYIFETARKNILEGNLPENFDDSWDDLQSLKNMFSDSFRITIWNITSIVLNFFPTPLIASEGDFCFFLQQKTGITLPEFYYKPVLLHLQEKGVEWEKKLAIRAKLQVVLSNLDPHTKSLMKMNVPGVPSFLLFHLLLPDSLYTQLSPEESKKAEKIKNSLPFRDAWDSIENDVDLKAQFKAILASLPLWEQVSPESADVPDDLKSVICPLKELSVNESNLECFKDRTSGCYLEGNPLFEEALSDCDEKTLIAFRENDPKIFVFALFKLFFELTHGKMLHVQLNKNFSFFLLMSADLLKKLESKRPREDTSMRNMQFMHSPLYREIRIIRTLSKRLDQILTSVATFTELDLSKEDPKLQELLRPLIGLANRNLSTALIKSIQANLFQALAAVIESRLRTIEQS